MDFNRQVRLTPDNAEKVQRVMNDLNMSASQVVNAILTNLKTVDFHFVVTVEVHPSASPSNVPQKQRIRRINRYVQNF